MQYVKNLYVECYVSHYEKEFITCANINKSIRKQIIFSTIKHFLSYAENNFDFDVYKVSLKRKDLSKPIKFRLRLNITKLSEFTIYNELSKFSTSDFHFLFANVAVHIGRKIMRANNPELDIFVFDFNKAKSKNK